MQESGQVGAGSARHRLEPPLRALPTHWGPAQCRQSVTARSGRQNGRRRACPTNHGRAEARPSEAHALHNPRWVPKRRQAGETPTPLSEGTGGTPVLRRQAGGTLALQIMDARKRVPPRRMGSEAAAGGRDAHPTIGGNGRDARSTDRRAGRLPCKSWTRGSASLRGIAPTCCCLDSVFGLLYCCGPNAGETHHTVFGRARWKGHARSPVRQGRAR
jgi:hypothetical protein